MCGVSFPLLDGDADFDEPQARCLFCDLEVLPSNPEALPDDMSVLMARHSEACAYRSLFSLISKRGKRIEKLSEPNKALLAFLKREVVRGRVGRGHSMDAICTSLALRYLGFKRTGTHFGVYSKNGEDMAEVLYQMTIPAVAGLYNFIHSFHGDGDGSCQVWPPKRERARRPKWSPGFRQVTVLPKLNEEWFQKLTFLIQMTLWPKATSYQRALNDTYCICKSFVPCRDLRLYPKRYWIFHSCDTRHFVLGKPTDFSLHWR